MVAAAAAASVIGMSVAAAPQALAIGDDSGPSVANGNGASSAFGNSSTKGDMSPQLSLVNGTLNKLCLAVQDVNVGVAAVAAVIVQDIPVLSDHVQQQCADNSANIKRDGALTHILEDVSFLSANTQLD
jgi:hypothetical protein